MKVLITRTDRLGDAILASPTWRALKKSRPEAEVTFLTRSAYLPLFRYDPFLSDVVALPEDGKEDVDELARRLSEEGFDALIALYVDGPTSRLIRKVRTPLKVGPLSKVRTWLLFNRPVWQRRSRSIIHEADYNGALLEALDIPYVPLPPKVHLSAAQSGRASALLEGLLGSRADSPYIVIHPGMGGSAGNWPPAYYRNLIQESLRVLKESIVITGSDADAPYLGDLPQLEHPHLINTVGRLDLEELALLLRGAELFVGPSTGPMHLATALSTPVVTLFSPLAVQAPRRWGPYHTPASVITPPVECRQRYRCRPTHCRHYDCMERIDVEEVLAHVRRWLHPAPPGSS